MKKHAGKAFYLGVMTLVFGLILMGAVNFATNVKSDGFLADVSKSMVKTTSEISFGLVVIGVLALILGIFMHTRN
ncbi:Uncharacterised protein [Candidatus Bilamarchaeum dharawalense]|uniref:Uncharacterized protein n=1 Tax=Candidatus Bilamarchaeum dharawalense TaxID=2885759 RepID=A0A5E4LMR7_9ARCH|nr:Uncharacterised protein [Candidatus Bilamarchaeum dharawalense]